MPTTSAIFFDAYGTLFDVTGSARGACAGIAPDPDRFVAAWRRRQLEYSWLRSLMGRYVGFDRIAEDALDATAAAEGLRLSAEQRRQLLATWLRPGVFPDVAPALARLAGHRLGVLSNGSPGMLAADLGHAGLAGAFAWVLSVDEVATYKPAPAVYDLAARAVGGPRDQVLYVTANSWDVAGAAAFGFTTCWVNRGNNVAERLGFEPSRTVQSLGEIGV